MTGLAHVKRNQLALLAEACADAQAVSIALRSGAGAWQTNFCGLSASEVLVQHPRGAEGGLLIGGAPIEGRFSHNGSAWTFFSTILGRHEHTALGAILRLSAPLMLQSGERRSTTRYAISQQHTIDVQFTSVLDAARTFPGCVFDLSDRGVGAEIAAAHCDQLSIDELFWIEVLPHGGGPCASFVARVAHRGRAGTAATRFGFEFQGGDNSEAFERNLARLEGMLQQCSAHRTSDAAAPSDTGVSKC